MIFWVSLRLGEMGFTIELWQWKYTPCSKGKDYSMEIHEPERKCVVESTCMRMKRRGNRSYIFVAVRYRLPGQTEIIARAFLRQNTKLKQKKDTQ